MHAYYYLRLSTVILMVSTSLHAALVPVVSGKFKTEADIPTSNSMYKGFAVGFAQQIASLGIGIACSGSKENADKAALGVFIQWPVCFMVAAVAHGVVNDSIHTLTKVDELSSDWLHDKILGHSNITSRYKFLQQYKQLRSKNAVSEHVCDSAAIYATYNTMLEECVKRRAFIKGYAAVSALGPLPSMAAMWMLISLGAI